MNKKDIIQIIKDAESKIDKIIFSSDDNSKNGIGCNQFRELANICGSAECYEEIELLVRYNEAKDRPKQSGRHGSSWDCLMKDGKMTLADIVISCMEKIKAQSEGSSCLENLSLFFGYFYWNARIWAAENSEKPNGNQRSNGNQRFNGNQKPNSNQKPNGNQKFNGNQKPYNNSGKRGQ